MSDLVDDPSSTYYDEGRALLESGDVRGAIAKFEASIAYSPHFKSLELLGEAFLRIGNPQRAIVYGRGAQGARHSASQIEPLDRARLVVRDRATVRRERDAARVLI